MPKSGNHIFLEAIQTLQSCQQRKGVLGGTILYHNKVVATQLSPDLTKKFILTDPYRIKPTAEAIHVDFHVPVGVQLLVVYITSSEYRKLKDESIRAQSSFNNNANILPFQIKRKMKRDKSLIFTNIPEEEVITTNTNSIGTALSSQSKSNVNFNRPTHLPLRFKNITSKDIPESGFSSINFDETDSFPEFIGKTSVVSTPMTENKILHGDVLSICVNSNELKIHEKPSPKNHNNSIPIETLKNVDPILVTDFSNYMNNPLKTTRTRSNSLSDLQNTIKQVARKLSLRPFGIGLQKLQLPSQHISSYDDDDDENDVVDDVENNKVYRTISDPTYPVFDSNGKPISKYLYQFFMESYNDDVIKINDIIEAPKLFRDFDGPINNKISSEKTSPLRKVEENKTEIIFQSQKMQNRKSLSLPIKSLNLEPDSKEYIPASAQITSATSIFDSPAKRKKLSGIQLTPLMNKLTLLAMNDEKSSGFSSWDATPGAEILSPIDGKPMNFKRRQSIKCDEISDETNTEALQRVELFVCGQQNMTLLVLIDENSNERQDLVHAMWEVCVSRLTKIESSLYQVLNLNVESNEKSEGGYSFMDLDSKWDILDRGGPWSPRDLASLEIIHKEFAGNSKMTEMLLRTDDSVVFGYQCGNSEIFYQQTAHAQVGLPPPADPMGNVPLCARRRLERDHSIVLL